MIPRNIEATGTGTGAAAEATTTGAATGTATGAGIGALIGTSSNPMRIVHLEGQGNLVNRSIAL